MEKGWLVEDEEGERLVIDLTTIVHCLICVVIGLLGIFSGFLLWLAFSPQIKIVLRFLQGLIF
jgi:hypothetical protein